VVSTNEPIKKPAFSTFSLNTFGVKLLPSFSVTVNVLVFKSVSTLATSGILLSCLLMALEHIEHVKPVALISAFTICALLFIENIKMIDAIIICTFFIFMILLISLFLPLTDLLQSEYLRD